MQEQAVSNHIAWSCNRCRRGGRIITLVRIETPNTSDLEVQIQNDHERIIRDHQIVSPNCSPIGFFDFDTFVQQLPESVF